MREYEWLLEKEYELRVNTITTQLQDCLKKFSDAFNSTGGLLACTVLCLECRDTMLCRSDKTNLDQPVSSDKFKAMFEGQLAGKGYHGSHISFC